MRRKDKKKEKKVKEEKQSVLKIAGNIFYMVRMMFRITPEYVIVNAVQVLLGAFVNFVCSVYLLRFILNGFQEGRDLWQVVIFVLAVYLMQLLYSWALNAFWAIRGPQLRLKVEEYMNELLFEKITEMELACYEDTKFYDDYIKVASDAVNRLYDVYNSVMNLLWLVVFFSFDSFLIIAIDPALIIFAVVPFVLTFFIGKADNKVCFRYDMENKEKERQRDYTRRTFYLADYAKEMRLTHIWRVMFERFEHSVEAVIAGMHRHLPLHALLQFLMTEARELIGSLGGLLYAVWATVEAGTMQYGDCLVVMNSVSTLSYIMSDTANRVIDFHAHSLYVENLRRFLAYRSALVDGPLSAPKRASLELKDVRFRYQGQNENTLCGISLTLHPGEKIALVGHNGAGKTTLAKLLLRLYDPTEGALRYGGTDVREYKITGEGGYRERFAVVFQDFKLFALSVADNILLRPRRPGDEEVLKQALAYSGADEQTCALPRGLESPVTREFEEDGVVFSGGQGQKLAIARAFAKDADIVILDEPSSALDPIAEYKMYENMMKTCADKAVVFISHRLSSAVLADTIYLLENGRIIEQGSHQALMALGGKYAEMFRVQAENYTTGEKEAMQA